MDRSIIYTGELPRSTDILFAQRATLIALSKLAKAIMGSNTVTENLACTPTSPASLQVNVAQGQIYQLAEVDPTAYGSLSADTSDVILKQGINLATTLLTTTAPSTAGYSINYLVEAQYQDADTNSVVLPYYNSASPSTSLNGPSGSGTAQPTERQGIVALQLKAGVAASTGPQVTPAADAGWVPLWVVSVANGQTQSTSANISAAPGSPSTSNASVRFQAAGVPSGLLNGSNMVYTLPQTPVGSVPIFINNLLATAGVDYSISGPTITKIGTALSSTDQIAFLEFRY